MSAMPDFVGEAVPDDSKTALIRKAAEEMFRLMVRKETMERALKETNEQLTEYKHKTLPELMATAGIDRMGLPEVNADLTEKSYYKAGIGAEWEQERKDAAFKYLDSIDAGSLIKTEITVRFGRGEEGKAKELESLIRKWSNEFVPIIQKAVQWNTLTAFVKERYESDPPEPLELDKIGATVGRIAEIKARKEKKAKR